MNAQNPKSQTGAQPALLRTAQAARRLCVSSSLLEKMRVSGDGPPFLKIGRIVCYSETDLEAWLATRLRRSTSAEA
jgi:predicted DNA-binding transcriptional regulator AlpA